MRAFRFSVQKLLDGKEALEKAAQGRMSEALRKLENAGRKLKELRASAMRQMVRVEQLRGTRTTRRELAVHLRYMDCLQKRTAKQSRTVQECEAGVDAVRDELLAATRERESLDHFKERERLQWLADARRTERYAMDEIATAGFIRGHGAA